MHRVVVHVVKGRHIVRTLIDAGARNHGDEVRYFNHSDEVDSAVQFPNFRLVRGDKHNILALLWA